MKISEQAQELLHRCLSDMRPAMRNAQYRLAAYLQDAIPALEADESQQQHPHDCDMTQPHAHGEAKRKPELTPRQIAIAQIAGSVLYQYACGDCEDDPSKSYDRAIEIAEQIVRRVERGK